MKNTKQNPQFTMLQIVADHQNQCVNAMQIGSEADTIFTLGVAFENDPEFYELIKKAIFIYQDFKTNQ
jgi:hypothetical protein